MSDERKRSSAGIYAIVILFVLPVLYVLGIGPLSWLFVQQAIPDWAIKPLQAAYTPLGELSRTDTPAGRVVLWYVSFWEDL